jgi:hypothetical protein
VLLVEFGSDGAMLPAARWLHSCIFLIGY